MQPILYWEQNRLVCANIPQLNTFVGNSTNKNSDYCLWLVIYPFSQVVIGMEFKSFLIRNNISLNLQDYNLNYISTEKEVKIKISNTLRTFGIKILEDGIESFI